VWWKLSNCGEKERLKNNLLRYLKQMIKNNVASNVKAMMTTELKVQVSDTTMML
jgi:hypothetical protein